MGGRGERGEQGERKVKEEKKHIKYKHIEKGNGQSRLIPTTDVRQIGGALG